MRDEVNSNDLEKSSKESERLVEVSNIELSAT